MRRLTAFAMAVLVLLALSPCAFARETLARPEEGQIIFVDADNDTQYYADFPLSSLKSVRRTEDDLLIELPAARLVLRGFFARLGEWRSIDFSDAKSIGGADFDEDGTYTGKFSTAGQFEKSGGTVSRAGTVLTVMFSPYGTEVLCGENAVDYELRNACIQTTELIKPVEKPDWQKLYRLYFEIVQESDGRLRPVRAEAVFNDGITVKVVNPSVVYISGSLSLMPLSEGRATVSYEAGKGAELFTLDVRCEADGNGGLSLSSVCPCCQGDQGGQLHYLMCGHYSCQDGYNEAGHFPAECGTVGHCGAEGDHSICKNCLAPVCSGGSHGYGQCIHVHNWMPITKYTSRCVVCNAEYTRPA